MLVCSEYFFSALLRWNGCMDSGVHRQELLAALGAVLQEPDALNWGAQCNRAIRLVFPLVDMKRKGKYKAYPFLAINIFVLLSYNLNVGCYTKICLDKHL